MTSRNILVVDDDPDFVDSVRAVLEDAGHRVEVAYDGQECLDKVKDFRPDLIVLDVMMPVMNGHEACKRLKADRGTADVPVVLLTAVASRVTSSLYTHRDMLDTEADEYIPKPVLPDELLRRIEGLL